MGKIASKPIKSTLNLILSKLPNIHGTHFSLVTYFLLFRGIVVAIQKNSQCLFFVYCHPTNNSWDFPTKSTNCLGSTRYSFGNIDDSRRIWGFSKVSIWFIAESWDSYLCEEKWGIRTCAMEWCCGWGHM